MGDWFTASQAATDASASNPVDEIPFVSRRSPIVCRNGCVASSQPLASSIGLDLLRKGANAADAAIAVGAALAVLEPVSRKICLGLVARWRLLDFSSLFLDFSLN